MYIFFYLTFNGEVSQVNISHALPRPKSFHIQTNNFKRDR